MVNKTVVGIDVAGSKKGFALAAYDTLEKTWLELRHVQSHVEVLDIINRLSNVGCIAIDCPPKAIIDGAETRSAERELKRKGYNMQWTRRRSTDLEPQEWMSNGQRLWEVLTPLHGKLLIETFPTAACDSAADCEMNIPLCKFAGKVTRDHYKDIVDAALCAWVAQKKLLGLAQMAGLDDELGPIYY